MINDIIAGISMALCKEFTEREYTVYTEEVKQGLKEPCFFIFSLNPDSSVFLGKRYFCRNPFVIQYIPAEETQRECNDAAERLADCLEFITLPGEDQPIRGTGMHCEIQDGVLQFFVNYDLFLVTAEEAGKMEALIQSSAAK